MSQPEKKPWLAVYDRYKDYDGGISGDKEGLSILKDAITNAIETGDVIKLPDSVDADFESVRVAEICDRNVEPTRKDKLVDPEKPSSRQRAEQSPEGFGQFPDF